jgi:hypothetical protein
MNVSYFALLDMHQYAILLCICLKYAIHVMSMLYSGVIGLVSTQLLHCFPTSEFL